MSGAQALMLNQNVRGASLGVESKYLGRKP